ncbi:MAG: hypothetical protein KJ687_04890 [Proteobacteria bacterium]|nr:hypothetical protein [Pseudomonadota bacterium]
MKAFHISFEGTSGAGKSTQARALVKRLCDCGVRAEYVKNPNGTTFSKAVMDVIMAQSPCKLAEIFAFASCFCQTTHELVVPLMEKGVCIVSDRGIGSAYAHALHRCEGTIDERLFTRMVTAINNGGVLFPDMTFLLSIPATKGVARKRTCNRLDELTPGSLREALAYRRLSRKFQNWITIDSNQSIDAVTEEVWSHVGKLIEEVRP